MPETRSVEYVKFALPPARSPLEGREKVDALQKVADAASAFAEQASSDLLRKGGCGRRPGNSERVRNSTVRARHCRQAMRIPRRLATGSQESRAVRVSSHGEKSCQRCDPVRGRLFRSQARQVNPQRPLDDRGSPPRRRRAGLARARRSGLLRERAEAALAKIREAMSAGKSFQDAAAAAGLQVRSFNDLVPSGRKLSPEEQEIAAATAAHGARAALRDDP